MIQSINNCCLYLVILTTSFTILLFFVSADHIPSCAGIHYYYNNDRASDYKLSVKHGIFLLDVTLIKFNYLH